MHGKQIDSCLRAKKSHLKQYKTTVKVVNKK